MRLDKFLKVSRLIKRRTVANKVSEQGRIYVNGVIAKPAKQLKEDFGKFIKIYDTTIPMAIKVAESSSEGKSILSYDKNGKVAEAYCSIAKEVLNNGNERKKTAVINAITRWVV